MVDDLFGILGMTLAGTFHIEEVIAEGGFGVVYRAEHVAFRAPVALKCLKIPGTISPNQAEEFVENFREEAEILFHLSAQIPEVVRPLHADAMTLEDGTFVPYVAMEWVEGKPLDSIVIMRDDAGEPPLSVAKVRKMLTPIAHALAHAHQFQVPGGAIVSVTHCDLKPENIIITERDNPVRAKILDFGIAKARDMMRMDVGRMTDSEHSRPFTPSYGAPEQWVPKRYGQSGPWTDVWGLALTIVECVTGQPPIDGDMHAMMGTALDKGRRPTPGAEGIEVGPELEEVFNKALAVDPRDRYTDIESFWAALEEADGAPSSFEYARKRRSVRTYDEIESAAPETDTAASAGEFDGLEYEEDGGFVEPEPSPTPQPAPPTLDSAEYESDPFSVKPEGEVSSDEYGLSSGDDLDAFDPGDFGSRGGDIDLDMGSLAPPAPRPSNSRAAASSGNIGRSDLTASGQHQAPTPPVGGRAAAALKDTNEEAGGLSGQLRVPIILVVIGLGFTVLDMALAKSMGGTLSLGPVRLRWIAVGLAAVGMLMAFWNLLGDRDDD